MYVKGRQGRTGQEGAKMTESRREPVRVFKI